MKNELILKEMPKSIISEDIRTIRTNLEFSLSEYDKKIVMMTSPLPNEGKSFISSNLAIALAQNDNKVLLIDCDLRRGRLHNIFSTSNKVGLSNLIMKYNEDYEIVDVLQKTKVKKLYLLPRGTIPPNPSELLSSKKFKSIMDDLQDVFDYIIIDSVPVNGLPDALILSKLVDKVVIVTKYGSTNIEMLEETKKALDNVNANIAGVVINKISKPRNKYKYYYYGDKND